MGKIGMVFPSHKTGSDAGIYRENSPNMSDRLRIYLDACCLNRPFDNQNQPRIA